MQKERRGFKLDPWKLSIRVTIPRSSLTILEIEKFLISVCSVMFPLWKFEKDNNLSLSYKYYSSYLIQLIHSCYGDLTLSIALCALFLTHSYIAPLSPAGRHQINIIGFLLPSAVQRSNVKRNSLIFLSPMSIITTLIKY